MQVSTAPSVVELALKKSGNVYVRHEIVTISRVAWKAKRRHFWRSSRSRKPAPVIFWHWVPKSVPAAAQARNMFYLDATCPLVSKVHVEARTHYDEGLEIVLIGHAGHPEVIGTLGQLPMGAATLIETTQSAQQFAPRDPDRLAYITQTTLSVDDTAAIVAILKMRFPNIVGPRKEDICYATTNRQAAAKVIAPRCDALIVVGAQTAPTHCGWSK